MLFEHPFFVSFSLLTPQKTVSIFILPKVKQITANGVNRILNRTAFG